MKLAISCAVLLFGLWVPRAFANAALQFGCNGTVFIMPGMTDQRNVLVLTNGHCIGLGGFQWQGSSFPAPGEFLIDRDLQTHEKTKLAIFKHPGQDPTIFSIEKIVFATLTGSDLAIVQINTTYAELRRLGYRIFTIAQSLPPNGTTLYFLSYTVKHEGICAVAKTVAALVEGPFESNNVLKLTLDKRCGVPPGVSGTAGLQSGSDQIYAAANTEYTGPDKNCDIMNPCERDADTGALIFGVPGQAYAIPTSPLHACYDAASAQFNFKLAGCALIK